MTNQIQEFIEHVGVKGMRWGVRNQSRVNSAMESQAVGAKRRMTKLEAKEKKLDLSTKRGRKKQSKITNAKFDNAMQYALSKPTKTIYITREGQEYRVKGKELVDAFFSGKRIVYNDIRLDR